MLTAASVADRCFPGAVRTVCSPALLQAPLLLWPWLHLTFGDAVAEILGPGAWIDGQAGAPHAVIFGNAPELKGALRVTFDGWIAKVGPVHDGARLPEREYFSAAGILAASLALSELFLSLRRNQHRGHAPHGSLSLWRPDLDIGDPEALGMRSSICRATCGCLGWAISATLISGRWRVCPTRTRRPSNSRCCDFDTIEKENVETGVIFRWTSLIGSRRARCDAGWVVGDSTTRPGRAAVRRRFRRHDKEPALALCGFNSNPARRDLGTAQFVRVIDSGLGGIASNFDTISLHALAQSANARRAVAGPERGRRDEAS